MSIKPVLKLDQQTLDLFARKGTQDGSAVPQMGDENGLKVRRVIQLIHDFSKKPFDQLSILDLACGEGVYAIEAALNGATVKAIDARTERMKEGEQAAKRIGLHNLAFEQMDIRSLTDTSHGSADVVLFLGILYHLHQTDLFDVLKNIYKICTEFIIIDTHIAAQPEVEIEHEGHIYTGRHYREHADNDSEQQRRSRVLSSIDNTTSFWFTKESMLRLLKNTGFSSVCECHVPMESNKPEDRITLIASKGEPVKISTYPWVNSLTDQEIEIIIAAKSKTPVPEVLSDKAPDEKPNKHWVNKILHQFGLKISRV
jgi:SAM-dependent methyltransferase